MPELPWLRVRASDGVFVVEGSPTASLGHRIGRPDGSEDGLWAGWRWDGRELLVETDRYGAFPVYYHATDDLVVVSPDIGALLRLGVPRSLDEDALAGFLGFGSYLGEDTPFRAIRAVPADGQLRWGPTGWTVSGRRAGFMTRPMTRRHIEDGVIEGMRASVSRRLRDGEGCIMPLSGGRDSRNILLELIRQGHPPRLCVTGQKGFLESDRDIRYAARLASEMGIPHRVLERPFPAVQAEKRKNELTGFCADEHAWYLRVSEALAGEAYTYDGFGGSTLLDRQHARRPKVRALLEVGRLDEAAHQMLLRRGQVRFADLVAPGMREVLSAERAAARIRVELERYLDRSEPLAALYFWNRAGRELNLVPTLMLSHVPTVFAPFLDHDLFDLLSAVPMDLIEHELHAEILALAYPEAAHVPLVAKGAPPAPGRSWLRRVNADLVRLLRGSSGRLVDRGVLTRTALRDTLVGGDTLVASHSVELITYLVQLEASVGDSG